MTCIAFDGKTLVADSRVVGNFINSKPVDKIVKVVNRRGTFYVGFAGNLPECLTFVEWFSANKPERQEMSEEFCAIVWNVDEQKLYYYDSSCYPVEVGIPYAIGSGAQFAMGAMLAGKSAKQAVEIACKLDNYCGLPLNIIKM